MRRLTILILTAAMVCGLSACGRKGRPLIPEDSVYPRTYPDTPFPDKGGQVEEDTLGEDEGLVGKPEDKAKTKRMSKKKKALQQPVPESRNEPY